MKQIEMLFTPLMNIEGPFADKSLLRNASGQIVLAIGGAAPDNGGTGFAVGCAYVQTAGNGSPAVYVNQGDAANCQFAKVTA